MKYCPRCRKEKSADEFYKRSASKSGLASYCISCSRAISADYYKNSDYAKAKRLDWHDNNKPANRRQQLLYKYGMTKNDFAVMLQSQGGVCAVCRTNEPGGNCGVFHVDHCHATGKVRGLLCHRCNVGLGCFDDNAVLLILAFNYIKKHTTP